LIDFIKRKALSASITTLVVVGGLQVVLPTIADALCLAIPIGMFLATARLSRA